MEATETQESAMTEAKPQKEHDWLQKLVGVWDYEMEMEAGPDGKKEVEKAKGTETGRLVGGLWVVLEGEGGVPGGTKATTIMTLGYDPQKGHYVGTWIGSMMTYLWVYSEGVVDPAGRSLTLPSIGPAMDGSGGTAQYKDVIELHSADHRTLTGNVRGEDGSWRPMMKVHYRRRK